MPKRTPYYEDAQITLHHGDWHDFQEMLRGDLLLTDPPYGINYQPGRYPGSRKFSAVHGDDKEITDLEKLLSLCPISIVWGANNFSNLLPLGGWIVWDKRTKEKADKILGSPFELAWCSKITLYKMIRIMHGGCVNANGHNSPRFHPTEKPIALMERCLSFFPKASTIIDPFCGSGSALIAAKKLGRKAIGVEIEQEYCEITAKRLGRPLKLTNKPNKGFFE